MSDIGPYLHLFKADLQAALAELASVDTGTLPLQLHDFVWEALVPDRFEDLAMQVERAEKLLKEVGR